MPSPYLQRPTRTLWQACHDIFELAIATRCPAMWDRGYRLWVYACARRAPGTPIQLGPYMARWLP